MSFVRQSPAVPSVPEPAGRDGRSVSGLPQGNRGTGCSIRRLVPQFYLAAAWCALCLASAVLCPYSPAFPISPVLPRLLLCSPVVWRPCPADASFYGLPGTSAALFRRSAQAREQARQAQTGTDRRKQARQVRTGADRRRQARFEVKPFRDRVFDVSVGAR